MLFSMSKLKLLGQAAIAAAALLAAPSIAAAQDGVQLIQNRWSPSQYITVQAGTPQAAATPVNAPEARWAIERAGAAAVFRLRNIATGLYLVAEGPVLRMGPATEADQGASWSLERVGGNPDARIRNVMTGGYLHTKDGPLVIGEASPEWQQSYWKFIPAGYVAQPALPPMPAVDGCKASFGKWLWINGKYVCAKGCPTGFHQAGNSCVKACAFGFHWNGAFCVKNCPPGFHPVGAACVKTCAPGFHPVGNTCVKNAACAPGFHLSLGHCCPNGQNWKPIPKKCM